MPSPSLRKLDGWLDRRRLRPIVVAIVLIASIALALLIAHYWAASAPYPYTM